MDRPVVPEYYRRYLTAFTYVNRSRPSGLTSMSFIPLSEYNALFHILGISDIKEREQYLDVLQEMDREYVALGNHPDTETEEAEESDN